VEGRTDFRIAPVIATDEGDLWAQLSFPGQFDDLRIGRFSTDNNGAITWHPLPRRIVELAGARGVYGLGFETSPTGERVLWASGQDNVLRIELDQLNLANNPPGVAISQLASVHGIHALTSDPDATPN